MAKTKPKSKTILLQGKDIRAMNKIAKTEERSFVWVAEQLIQAGLKVYTKKGKGK